MTSSATGPQERLLDVASRLFYAEGIHAVGIDRVVAEASVAKATLYAHFASKAELVAAYLARQSQAWVDANDTRLAGHRAGTAEAVLALFGLLHDESRGPGYRGCPFINAAAEFPAPGPVAAEIARHRERMRAVFSAAGGPLLADPAMLHAVIALYGGAMSAAHLDHDPAIVLHAAAAARSLLSSGPSGEGPTLG